MTGERKPSGGRDKSSGRPVDLGKTESSAGRHRRPLGGHQTPPIPVHSAKGSEGTAAVPVAVRTGRARPPSARLSAEQRDPLSLTEDDLKSVNEIAYEKIKAAILHGVFRPGQRLTERATAQRLKVSTSPVKRAFARLYHEGIINIKPRSGTFVADTFFRNIEENNLIRATLEGLSARFAARKASPDDIRRLGQIAGRMRESTDRGDARNLIELNYEFHDCIHQIGKNSYIRQLIQILRSLNQSNRSMRLSALADSEELERNLAEHIGIYQAIAQRQEDVAETRIKEHIVRSLSYVMSRVSTLQSQQGGSEGAGPRDPALLASARRVKH